ncbi:MAG: hypothetical protein ACI8RP_000893 [Urechidicola sp.]|jgi:hypothetical protein
MQTPVNLLLINMSHQLEADKFPNFAGVLLILTSEKISNNLTVSSIPSILKKNIPNFQAENSG